MSWNGRWDGKSRGIPGRVPCRWWPRSTYTVSRFVAFRGHRMANYLLQGVTIICVVFSRLTASSIRAGLCVLGQHVGEQEELQQTLVLDLLRSPVSSSWRVVDRQRTLGSKLFGRRLIACAILGRGLRS